MATQRLSLSEFTVAGVYIQSMAVAMIGGLTSSTILTLIALPVWYATVEDLGSVPLGLLPGGAQRRIARRRTGCSTGASSAGVPGFRDGTLPASFTTRVLGGDQAQPTQS